jgi:hypothetical protein
MIYPKVKSVCSLNNDTLVIEFDNSVKKLYNISPLLSNPVFEPLKQQSFFKAVQVEPGGYAISWNDAIDISEYELWNHGQTIA